MNNAAEDFQEVVNNYELHVKKLQEENKKLSEKLREAKELLEFFNKKEVYYNGYSLVSGYLRNKIKTFLECRY